MRRGSAMIFDMYKETEEVVSHIEAGVLIESMRHAIVI
jgi:hypothetical protein